MFTQMLSSFHQYTWFEGEELYTSQQTKTFILRSLHSFIFFRATNRSNWFVGRITYGKGCRETSFHPSVSSSICPSVRSSMRIYTLEAPRLPTAHLPFTKSDITAFCPPRMGRKSIHHVMFS
jgi:hypothetical protein